MIKNKLFALFVAEPTIVVYSGFGSLILPKGTSSRIRAYWTRCYSASTKTASTSTTGSRRVLLRKYSY